MMTKFNADCDAVPSAKAARLDILAKLLSLGLEPVDVPADGSCFLHAARFALLQLKNSNITLVSTITAIRSEVAKFLTTARLNVIVDGRTLDEVLGEMADLPSLDRRRSNKLEQYDRWFNYLEYMKQPDKYADTLFVIGFFPV